MIRMSEPGHLRPRVRRTAESDRTMKAQNRFWFRYGTAAIAAILVFLLLYLLRHYFADRTFMVIYIPVVVYAAFAGGLGPALLATVLCVGISLFFLGSDLFAN